MHQKEHALGISALLIAVSCAPATAFAWSLTRLLGPSVDDVVISATMASPANKTRPSSSDLSKMTPLEQFRAMQPAPRSVAGINVTIENRSDYITAIIIACSLYDASRNRLVKNAELNLPEDHEIRNRSAVGAIAPGNSSTWSYDCCDYSAELKAAKSVDCELKKVIGER
jgi:hypothetical protein